MPRTDRKIQKLHKKSTITDDQHSTCASIVILLQKHSF